jgi:alkanesulfonate monooxygenase
VTTPEIAWFGALCDDDYEQLGVSNPDLRSSWHHCSAIVREAERQGFDSVLLPSGYELGLDTVAMAAALARDTSRIKLLTAVRIGENHPPQLARQIATLQHLAEGRLNINIISSDLAGESLASGPRYQRTLEAMAILDDLGNGRPSAMHGAFYDLQVQAPRIATGPRPPFYFGGLSEDARDVAARAADVYLMWPDTMDNVAAVVEDMRHRAAAYGRTLRFGYRVHVVVRETEAEARAAAAHLVAALDDEVGTAIRAKSLDAASVGVSRQSDLRSDADADGYVEDNLWTGIGRARSGCGAALVGSPDQIVAKLEAYQELGMEAFILSGYPHLDECRRFGELVLPKLAHGPLVVNPGT